jgi:hypothetical protein
VYKGTKHCKCELVSKSLVSFSQAYLFPFAMSVPSVQENANWYIWMSPWVEQIYSCAVFFPALSQILVKQKCPETQADRSLSQLPLQRSKTAGALATRPYNPWWCAACVTGCTRTGTNTQCRSCHHLSVNTSYLSDTWIIYQAEYEM